MKNIESLNIDCYKHRLSLLSSYERLQPILDPTIKPRKNLLCTNTEEYLGKSYDSIMKILNIIREDKKLFQHIIHRFDIHSPSFPTKKLDRFAKDFVLLFFADFSSAQKNVVLILRQFEALLEITFNNFVNGNDFSLYGAETNMMNLLIKAFINSNENRDYLRLLFGKLFNETTDLCDYVKKVHQKKPSILSSDKEIITKDISNEIKFTKESQNLIYLIEDHFSLCSKIDSSSSNPNPTKEYEILKISYEVKPEENMKIENVLSICEGIISRVTRKLIHMPLTMRYFCKLIEKVAMKFVLLIYI